MAMIVKSLMAKLVSIFLGFVPVVAFNVVMDIFDEAMETLLEKAEATAKLTPEKSDDRRLTLYRKYWESFKDYRARVNR